MTLAGREERRAVAAAVRGIDGQQLRPLSATAPDGSAGQPPCRIFAYEALDSFSDLAAQNNQLWLGVWANLRSGDVLDIEGGEVGAARSSGILVADNPQVLHQNY